MKITIRLYISFILLVISPVSATHLQAEHVFLKDGSIIEGTIVREPVASVTVRTPDGKYRKVPRYRVMRLLYTDIYMGRRYVRLNDGTSFEAYLVDEDQKTYTFREDVSSPEEFTVPRYKVLFMSRSNPTELRGEVGNDRVRLKWYPPYRKPSHYIVYMKKNVRGGTFKKVARTKTPGHTARGLDPKTVYSFKVTAVDSEGVESVASNRYTVKTNVPPEPPDKTKVTTKPGRKQGVDAQITWSPATDPDGTVQGYRVYRELDRETRKIGETRVTNYMVKNLDTEQIHRFAITTIDNDNTESRKKEVIVSPLSGVQIAVRGMFLYPFGDAARLFSWGGGGMVTLSLGKPLVPVVTPGIEAGFLYFQGGGATGREMLSVPVLGTMWFNFSPTRVLTLGAVFSGGAAWNRYTHRKTFLVEAYPVRVGSSTRERFQPVGAASLSIGFRLHDRVGLFIRGGYFAVFETSGLMNFATAGIGFNYRL